MNSIDQRAKEALDKQTKQQTDGLQDEIWNNLEQNFFQRRACCTQRRCKENEEKKSYSSDYPNSGRRPWRKIPSYVGKLQDS